MMLCENLRFYQAVTPVANAFITGTGVHSRIVDMRNFRHCTFVIMLGGNGGATAWTITVEAVDVAAGTNAHEVPFWYSIGTTALNGNTMGALTRQGTPATGAPIPASAATLLAIVEVDASDCLTIMDTAGHEFLGVRCAVHESAGAAADTGAAILAILSEPRYMDTPPNQVAALLA